MKLVGRLLKLWWEDVGCYSSWDRARGTAPSAPMKSKGIITIAAWLQSEKKPKDYLTPYKATVAAVRMGKVRTHRQTPNTDDTEKCRLPQPSALFFLFFFFFFTADTNIWIHSFNTRAGWESRGPFLLRSTANAPAYTSKCHFLVRRFSPRS